MSNFPFEDLKTEFGEASEDSELALKILEDVAFLVEFNQISAPPEINRAFNMFQYKVLVKYFDTHFKKVVKDDNHKVLWLANNTDALKKLRDIGNEMKDSDVLHLDDKDVPKFVDRLHKMTKLIGDSK